MANKTSLDKLAKIKKLRDNFIKKRIELAKKSYIKQLEINKSKYYSRYKSMMDEKCGKNVN